MKYADSQLPIATPSEALLSPHEHPDERALEQERKHPLHRERLPDDTAGVLGKPRPVGPELKLHRDAGHDTDGKGEAEDLGPESCGRRVSFVARSQRTPLPVHEKPREPHRELGKQVVIGDGECELQPMPERGVVHDQIWPAMSDRCSVQV